MAHNLNVTDKGVAFFSANGLPAWHRLGTVIDKEGVHGEEALKLALLDWEVSKLQLHHPITNELIPSWGVFRNDNNDYLGTVGSQFTLFQNHEGVELVDTILLEDPNAKYVTAGALGKGEKIWLLAKINGDIRIMNTEDIHKEYLLFTMGHDGSLAITAKLVNTRVVCNNTLNVALGEKGNEVKIKHTANAKRRVEIAKQVIKKAHDRIKSIEDRFNELAQRKVTKESFMDVMTKLFGDFREAENKRTENRIVQIAGLFESNDKNAFPQFRGTAYNLLNAITEEVDHYAGFRRTGGRESMTDDAIRAENALFGTGADLKENALEVILEATANAPRHNPMVQIYQSVEIPKSSGSSLLDSICDNHVSQ